MISGIAASLRIFLNYGVLGSLVRHQASARARNQVVVPLAKLPHLATSGLRNPRDVLQSFRGGFKKGDVKSLKCLGFALQKPSNA